MKMRVRIGADTYEVEVDDLHARPILAHVEGETFEVWPENGHTAAPSPLPAPPAASGTNGYTANGPPAPVQVLPAPAPPLAASGGFVVRAPIPGVILSIAVKEGDTVTAGQVLCVLEAMKMQNSIRAPRAGRIGRVHVTVGQTIQHQDALLEYAD